MTAENAIYHSDSLILLEHLPDELVKLVYFDPPWPKRQDSINPDEPDLSQPIHADDEWADMLASYMDFLGIRIQHAHRVLTHDGNFYIHLEPEIAAYAKVQLDRIFKPENFRDQIIIPRRTSPARVRFSITYDVIIFYSKSDASTYHPPTRPLTEAEESLYSLRDNRGPYRLISLISPIPRETLRYEWRGIIPPPGRSWRYSKERLVQLEREGLISFDLSHKLPSRKEYLSEGVEMPIGSVWNDISVSLPQSEGTGFVTQQSARLLDRIIKMGTDENDIVLDPFCGSGTTLAAAHSANRRWIGCDISPEAYDIALQRLNTLGLKIERDYEAGTADQVVRTYTQTHSVALQTNIFFMERGAELNIEKPKLIPLVITEGKTDWKHLKAALARLKAARYYEADYDIKFLETEELARGDTVLLQMCRSLSIAPQSRPTIFIFDRDNPPTVEQASDPTEEFKDWGNNVFSFALPIPSHRVETPDICIEFYYQNDEIQRVDVDGRRLFLSNEFDAKSGRHVSENLSCFEMSRIRKRPSISIIDDNVFNANHTNVALSKNAFADNVLDGVENFDNFGISEFTKVFDIVSAIDEYVESQQDGI
jgi:DNA modification methylase